MGLPVIGTLVTTEAGDKVLEVDDVEVPVENLIGPENQGFGAFPPSPIASP